MSTLKDSKHFAFNGTKSSIASSSSSTTDFDDLLPDLWQTSSNESDIKHSLQSLFNSPHHYLFQQQPQQNWFNVSVSPANSVSSPLRSTSSLWKIRQLNSNNNNHSQSSIYHKTMTCLTLSKSTIPNTTPRLKSIHNYTRPSCVLRL